MLYKHRCSRQDLDLFLKVGGSAHILRARPAVASLVTVGINDARNSAGTAELAHPGCRTHGARVVETAAVVASGLAGAPADASGALGGGRVAVTAAGDRPKAVGRRRAETTARRRTLAADARCAVALVGAVAVHKAR